MYDRATPRQPQGLQLETWWDSTTRELDVKPPLRVGIVGAGRNTIDRHIPGLRAVDGVEIVGVANRSRDSSARVAEAHGIPGIFDDWHELVSDPGIDAVVVGTWPNMHAPVSVAALQAGKHVLCEARMASNLVEAQRMLSASQDAPDLVAQVVPSPLSFGVDAAIQRLIADGYVGSPIAIDVEARGGGFPDPGRPIHWREDADISGRNIMSLGIWYESLMRWVGEAAAVTAFGNVTVPVRTDSSGVRHELRIPDHLDVLAQMVSGAQAVFRLSSVTGMAPDGHATLYGADGVVRFSDGALFGARRGDQDLSPLEIEPEESGSWNVEADFVDSIRTGRAVTLTSFETGVKYMEFTEAVWQSIEQARTVTVSDQKLPG